MIVNLIIFVAGILVGIVVCFVGIIVCSEMSEERKDRKKGGGRYG